jgi:poly-gamma-glutamate capsule biosynthesis protein CapA/YwtB (metallophosphatase superfamily)
MFVRCIAVFLCTAAIATCSATPVPTPAASRTLAPTGEQRSRAATPPATPRSTPSDLGIPLVPVTGFWSKDHDITLTELRAALAGESRRWRTVIGDESLVGRLADRLGRRIGPGFRAPDMAGVIHTVSADPKALGIVAAADVTPSVRALSVDGRALFGTHRGPSLSGWPLVVPFALGVSADAHLGTFDPARLWTLVAGGDVMLDRDVYRATQLHGVDYPWAGGTVRIVARTCCTSLGRSLPVPEAVAGSTSIRELFQQADVAIVNLEGPAPDAFDFHPAGHVFTFDPVLLEGLRHVGIDLTDLANNHIGNAGAAGIAETIAHLDDLGIAHVGAGHDLSSARAAAMLQTPAGPVAVLGYDNIDDGDHATQTSAGTAALDVRDVTVDVAASRAAGARMVVVLLHWGIEYQTEPVPSQRQTASAILAAGADLIIGSHSHVAGAIADGAGVGAIGDRLAFFSLGDLVFDIDRSEETLEGLVPELTFDGTRLVQVDLHPTLIVGLAQPNLLASDDAVKVLDRVRHASAGMLDW